MKVQNKLGYIHISYESLSEIIADESKNLEITMSMGCSNVFTSVIPDVTSEFMLNLSQYKNKTETVVGISGINFNAGISMSADVGVDFSQYLADCPSGCTLESLSPLYDDIFKSKIEALLGLLGSDASSLNVTFVGDTLKVSGLEDGIVLEKIDISNGATESFTAGANSLIVMDSGIYISPSFMSVDKFEDGVYGIVAKEFSSDGSWVEKHQCFFNDETIKCRVSRYMKELLNGGDKSSKELHILHYSLVNASNCGDCNCTNLCAMYNKIISILNNNANSGNSGNKEEEDNCSECE